MARTWNESKVRRDRRGRFADRTSSGGWAKTISESVEHTRSADRKFDPLAVPRDAKWMAARRKDAVKPPPFRVPSKREARLVEFRAELAAARRKLAKVKRDETAARKKLGDQFGESHEYSWGQSRRNAEGKIRQIEGNIDLISKADPAVWDVPEPYAKLIFAGELDPKRPLAVYGDLLRIGGGAASERHLRDLEKIPAQLHRVVAEDMFAYRAKNESHNRGQGAGVYLGAQPAPFMGGAYELVGQQPRGWSKGSTWQDVDGVYQAHERRLIAGHTSNTENSGESAVAHEFGHALDAAIGEHLWRKKKYSGDRHTWYSQTPEWKKLHAKAIKKDERNRVAPYFKQEGDAGPREMFAEAFGAWAKGMARPITDDDLQFIGKEAAQQHHGSAALWTSGSLGLEIGVAEEMHQHFLKLSKDLGVQW